jgi:hypothetical protein
MRSLRLRGRSGRECELIHGVFLLIDCGVLLAVISNTSGTFALFVAASTIIAAISVHRCRISNVIPQDSSCLPDCKTREVRNILRKPPRNSHIELEPACLRTALLGTACRNRCTLIWRCKRGIQGQRLRGCTRRRLAFAVSPCSLPHYSYRCIPYCRVVVVGVFTVFTSLAILLEGEREKRRSTFWDIYLINTVLIETLVLHGTQHAQQTFLLHTAPSDSRVPATLLEDVSACDRFFERDNCAYLAKHNHEPQ